MAHISILTASSADESRAEDAEQVRQAQSNPVLFAGLYRKYALSVYRYLYNRVGRAEDAEDLTSQVFLEALEYIHRFQPTGTFTAWLFTIARRRAIDQFRKRRSMGELGEYLPQPGNDPLAQVIQDEELSRLAEKANQLEPDERELLRLRYAAGLPFTAIGELMNRTPDAARMALRRLLDKLGHQLEVRDE